MKWIKASENKLASDKDAIVRWYEQGEFLRIDWMSGHYLYDWANKNKKELEDIEWLDESEDQETLSLRAENEKLREEVRVLTETVNIQHGLMTDAEQRGIVKGESENAALRQQVRELELSNLNQVNAELQVLTTKAENKVLRQQVKDMGEVIKELKQKV